MFGQGILPKMLNLLDSAPSAHALGFSGRARPNQPQPAPALFQRSALRQMLDELAYPVMPAQNTLGMWISYFRRYLGPAGGMQAFRQHPRRASSANTAAKFTLGRRCSASGWKMAGQPVSRWGMGRRSTRTGSSPLPICVTPASSYSGASISPAPDSPNWKGAPLRAGLCRLPGAARQSRTGRCLQQRFHEPHVIFTCADGRMSSRLSGWTRTTPRLSRLANTACLSAGWIITRIGNRSRAMTGRLPGPQSRRRRRTHHPRRRIPAWPARPHRGAGGRLPADLRALHIQLAGCHHRLELESRPCPALQLRQRPAHQNFSTPLGITPSTPAACQAMITAWYIAREILQKENLS
jgi:hypothetical protein